MSRQLVSIAVALAVNGCVTVERTASVFAVKPHEAELATGRPIRVETNAGTQATLDPAQEVEVIDKATGHRTRVRLADVYARGCPPTTAYDQLCTLEHVNEIVVGHERHAGDLAYKIPIGVAIVGGVGGLAYCAFECSSGWRTAARGTFIGVGVLAVGFLVLSQVFHGYTPVHN